MLLFGPFGERVLSTVFLMQQNRCHSNIQHHAVASGEHSTNHTQALARYHYLMDPRCQDTQKVGNVVNQRCLVVLTSLSGYTCSHPRRVHRLCDELRIWACLSGVVVSKAPATHPIFSVDHRHVRQEVVGPSLAEWPPRPCFSVVRPSHPQLGT